MAEIRNAGELRLRFLAAAAYKRGHDPMRAQTLRITGAGAEDNCRNCGCATRRCVCIHTESPTVRARGTCQPRTAASKIGGMDSIYALTVGLLPPVRSEW